MLWVIAVYPRAAAVLLATLFAFAAVLWVGLGHPILTAAAALAVAAGGTALGIRMSRAEARARGGTGDEGSGPIEPLGPGSFG